MTLLNEALDSVSECLFLTREVLVPDHLDAIGEAADWDLLMSLRNMQKLITAITLTVAEHNREANPWAPNPN